MNRNPLKKTIKGKKTGREVIILEGNLPDKIVNRFLSTIDKWGQRKMRHAAEQKNEYQYFALAPIGRGYKIIGYGALYPRNNQDVNWGITLHQDWRGEKIGKAMYEFAEELCGLWDIRVLRGEVDADNELVIGLFRRMDYELYGPIYLVKKQLKEYDPPEPEPDITPFGIDELIFGE